MENSVLGLLHEAQKTGEMMTLCYGGGSQPGKERKVVVVKVDESSFWAGELKSEDLKSGLRGRKQFNLNKVIWLSDSQGNRIDGSFSTRQVVPIFNDLHELAEHCRKEFEPQGWHIMSLDNFLGLCRYFKNGKPRKIPVVSICYIDRSTMTVWDLETDGFIEVPVDTTHSRPWRVDSERFKDCKTYGRFDRANEVFLEEARAAPPA